jgi:hypothetical protein
MKTMRYSKHWLLLALAILTAISSACATLDNGTDGKTTEMGLGQIAENYVSSSPTFLMFSS